MNRNICWPRTLMLLGFIVWLIGELKGATNEKRNDTLSEIFRDLPAWVKMFISFCIGGVCVHLWEWEISDDDVTINAENIEQLTVEEN